MLAQAHHSDGSMSFVNIGTVNDGISTSTVKIKDLPDDVTHVTTSQLILIKTGEKGDFSNCLGTISSDNFVYNASTFKQLLIDTLNVVFSPIGYTANVVGNFDDCELPTSLTGSIIDTIKNIVFLNYRKLEVSVQSKTVTLTFDNYGYIHNLIDKLNCTLTVDNINSNVYVCPSGYVYVDTIDDIYKKSTNITSATYGIELPAPKVGEDTITFNTGVKRYSDNDFASKYGKCIVPFVDMCNGKVQTAEGPFKIGQVLKIKTKNNKYVYGVVTESDNKKPLITYKLGR